MRLKPKTGSQSWTVPLHQSVSLRYDDEQQKDSWKQKDIYDVIWLGVQGCTTAA